MNAGTREEIEGGGFNEDLVQKLEGYLRAHFDGNSVMRAHERNVDSLLYQVSLDWCLNRGMHPSWELLHNSAMEALKRYKANWDGKEQGEDDRSHNFGRALSGSVKEYSA